MFNHIFIFLLSLILTNSSLPELTPSSMDGSYFLVQIISTSPSECPTCSSQGKELENAGKVMEGVIKVGQVNPSSVPAVKGMRFEKNPSYVLFKGSLNDYVQYSGKVSRISFCKFAISELEKTVREKDQKLFGSKGASKDSSKSSSKEKAKEKKKEKKESKDRNGVIALTDADFEQVFQSDDAWFVEIYSPSCGHCQALQPEWDKLPEKIGKRVKIAKLDGTQNRQTLQKFQVKGFPTLLLFVGEKKSGIQYDGERTADAMVSWLNTQPIGEEKIQFQQLSQEKYDKECNKNIVCLIFILSSKSELKSLDFVEDIMEEQKGKPLRYFYSKRLPFLEQTLMIEDRETPKLVSFWDSLNSYKVYNGRQEKEDIDEYIKKIMQRRSWIRLQDGKIKDIMFRKQNAEL